MKTSTQGMRAMTLVVLFGAAVVAGGAQQDFTSVIKRIGSAKGNKLKKMSFESCGIQAMLVNPRAIASGDARDEGKYLYESSRGVYDWVLFSDVTTGVDEYEESTSSHKIGISKKLPSGTVLSAYASGADGSVPAADDPLNAAATSTWTNVNDGDINFKVVQPLLKGGWRTDAHASVLMAEAQMKAARSSDWTTENDVLEEACTVYVDLVTELTAYQVIARDCKFAEKLVARADEKVKSGVLSGLERLRAKAELLRKKERLGEKEGAIAKLQAELRTLLALDAKTWIVPVDSLPDKLTIPKLSKAIVMAMRNSGVIAEHDAIVTEARVRMEASKWRKYPSLDVQVQVNQNSGDSGSSADWYAGLFFQYPLGNRDAANTYKADAAAYRKVKNEREEAGLKLRGNLEGLYANLGTKKRTVDSLTKRIKLARKRVGIEREKYLMGAAKFIELSDAQGEKVEIEEDLAMAKAAVVKVRLNILREIGTLIKMLPVDTYRAF